MSPRKKLLILILAIFMGLPSVSFAGSFVVSLVQGKTPTEAVQIIAEQLDGLLGRVDILETKQAQTTARLTLTDADIERLKLENANLKLQNENLKIQSGNLEKEQLNQFCSDAVKTVPKTYTYGENYDLTKSIIRYYTMSKFILDNQLDAPEYLKSAKKMVDESTPLYEEFKNKCPDYSAKELPTKTAWCVLAEKNVKCMPLSPSPTDRDKVLNSKFSEFGCDGLLKNEVPNRSQYTCG